MTTSPDMPAGLSAYEAALHLRTWTLSANSYSRSRKNRFRLFSSATKILSLVLSGAATIILGLQNLTFWAGLGFSLVALTTVVNAVEPFFNWRSRWVLAEEAQHGFYRLQEDLEYLVATRRPEELRVDDLEEFYNRYKKTWNEFSEKWLENRRRVAESGGTLSMNLARYLGYGTSRAASTSGVARQWEATATYVPAQNTQAIAWNIPACPADEGCIPASLGKLAPNVLSARRHLSENITFRGNDGIDPRYAPCHLRGNVASTAMSDMRR